MDDDRMSFTRMGSLTKETRKANLMGRVYNFSRVVEFQKKDGTKGKVVNVYLSDGTGAVRMVLWDRQVAAVEEGNLNIGDVIQVVNGMVRENSFESGLEIIPGRFSSVNLVESGDHSIPPLEDIRKRFLVPGTQRMDIKDLVPGVFEVKGTVTSVVRGRNVFYSCPICGSKVDVQGNVTQCAEHGVVLGEPVMVFNIIIDDGTGELRAAFFRDAARKALETDVMKFASMGDDERHRSISDRLLGREIILSGRVKKNESFGVTEMIVSDIKDINPLEESRRLLEELEKEIG